MKTRSFFESVGRNGAPNLVALVRGRGTLKVTACATLVGVVALIASFVMAPSGILAAAPPLPGLTAVHNDSIVDPIALDSSEDQPSIAAWGNTIVATQQTGRIYDGGAAAIGFETSPNGGKTWAHGGLIPITVDSGQASVTCGTNTFTFTRASNVAVAYSARYGVWLATSIGLDGAAAVQALLVNQSSDGLTWSAPICTHVAGASDTPDKPWITCDNWSTSAGYGDCYLEYDNTGASTRLLMQTSTDGGNTWSTTSNSAPGNGNTGDLQNETILAATANPGDTNIKVNSVSGASIGTVGATLWIDIDPSGGNQEAVTITAVGTAGAAGTGVTFTPALTKPHVLGAPVAHSTNTPVGHTGDIGGQPIVQPPDPSQPAGTVCGRVIDPFAGGGGVSWITSSDCGHHWSAHTEILPNMTATHTAAGGLRTSLLPNATMDGAGNIYLVWQTRSFRTGATSATGNDIAMSVMPAPTAAQPNPPFAAPTRIPIDTNTNALTNPNDYFIPGIAADLATSGTSAHLGLFYYTYPNGVNNAVGGNCQYANPDGFGGGSQCNLEVGYVSSTDGGAHWADPAILASMTLAEVVRSSQGPMVGDYMGATVIPAGPFKGNAIAAFAVGIAGNGSDNTLDEGLYVPTHGLSVGMPITEGATEQQAASPDMIATAESQLADAAPNDTWSDEASSDDQSSPDQDQNTASPQWLKQLGLDLDFGD
jgi:hypothetical protein